MTSTSRVRWVERTLFVAGAALLLWSLFVWLRAEYYARLPIPEPPTVSRVLELPGEAAVDDEGGGSRAGTAPGQGTWLARLDAPALRLSATVLEGSDPATLSRAAGHIVQTPLPGEPGNIGIAGHRDTVFRPLRNVKAGDELTLTTADRIFTYRVSETSIVNPEDVSVLDPTPRQTLTLVTCYPFTYIGAAPKRFIVRAELTADKRR